MEYCGHTVNFKTHRQSYKIKKTIENPPDQWKIFRNTHEAIVDEETFDRVQELRRNKRRPAKTGKSNLFSGVAYCADCGEKLYYCTTQNFEERQDHFVCSTSRKKGKDVCGTHFIRAMVLEKGVLKFLQIFLWYISDCEDLFREKLGAKRKEEFKKELAAKRRDSSHRHSAGSRNLTDCSSGFMRTIFRARSMCALLLLGPCACGGAAARPGAGVRYTAMMPDMPFLVLELLPASGNSAVCRKEEKFVQIA